MAVVFSPVFVLAFIIVPVRAKQTENLTPVSRVVDDAAQIVVGPKAEKRQKNEDTKMQKNIT